MYPFSTRDCTEMHSWGLPVLIVGMMAVPIEEVQLFDWALAHTTVNSTHHGLTASASDDFMGLFTDDPYTSNQQKERDGYELNDTDWYEVSFEEMFGDSYCKLALHKSWMDKQGGYEVGAVLELNLPEQGIQGPNKITSIKHIIPQKRPVDEDPDDDFEYRPVTGIFVHSSNDVWKIRFDNNDSLGVTSNHPIYSTTYQDWRFAGELEIEEKVLTFENESVVTSKEKQEGEHKVFNLEVRGCIIFWWEGMGLWCITFATMTLNNFLQRKGASLMNRQ